VSQPAIFIYFRREGGKRIRRAGVRRFRKRAKKKYGVAPVVAGAWRGEKEKLHNKGREEGQNPARSRVRSD